MSDDSVDPEVRQVFTDLIDLVSKLKKVKPNDRSDADRRFAIAITELEKIEAYFQYYIIDHQGALG